jgi:hypothetical protein
MMSVRDTRPVGSEILVKNIFEEDEPDRPAVVKKFFTTAAENNWRRRPAGCRPAKERQSETAPLSGI